MDIVWGNSFIKDMLAETVYGIWKMWNMMLFQQKASSAVELVQQVIHVNMLCRLDSEEIGKWLSTVMNFLVVQQSSMQL